MAISYTKRHGCNIIARAKNDIFTCLTLVEDNSSTLSSNILSIYQNNKGSVTIKEELSLPQPAFQLHLLNQAQPFYQESITRSYGQLLAIHKKGLEGLELIIGMFLHNDF